MALQAQTIQVPFAGGLDTKTADPIIRNANDGAENVVFTRPGQLSNGRGRGRSLRVPRRHRSWVRSAASTVNW